MAWVASAIVAPAGALASAWDGDRILLFSSTCSLLQDLTVMAATPEAIGLVPKQSDPVPGQTDLGP